MFTSCTGSEGKSYVEYEIGIHVLTFIRYDYLIQRKGHTNFVDVCEQVCCLCKNPYEECIAASGLFLSFFLAGCVEMGMVIEQRNNIRFFSTDAEEDGFDGEEASMRSIFNPTEEHAMLRQMVCRNLLASYVGARIR